MTKVTLKSLGHVVSSYGSVQYNAWFIGYIRFRNIELLKPKKHTFQVTNINKF